MPPFFLILEEIMYYLSALDEKLLYFVYVITSIRAVSEKSERDFCKAN